MGLRLRGKESVACKVEGEIDQLKKRLGVSVITYAAAIHADHWIPILPNTDAALQLAIIYVWIKEATYEKSMLTHI